MPNVQQRCMQASQATSAAGAFESQPNHPVPNGLRHLLHTSHQPPAACTAEQPTLLLLPHLVGRGHPSAHRSQMLRPPAPQVRPQGVQAARHEASAAAYTDHATLGGLPYRVDNRRQGKQVLEAGRAGTRCPCGGGCGGRSRAHGSRLMAHKRVRIGIPCHLWLALPRDGHQHLHAAAPMGVIAQRQRIEALMGAIIEATQQSDDTWRSCQKSTSGPKPHIFQIQKTTLGPHAPGSLACAPAPRGPSAQHARCWPSTRSRSAAPGPRDAATC